MRNVQPFTHSNHAPSQVHPQLPIQIARSDSTEFDGSKIMNQYNLQASQFIQSVSDLKDNLKKGLKFLQFIRINAMVDMRRHEALHLLFLQDDLRIQDFPQIQKIEIQFHENQMEKQKIQELKNRMNSEQNPGRKNEILMQIESYQKRYDQTLQEIQEELLIHLKIRNQVLYGDKQDQMQNGAESLNQPRNLPFNNNQQTEQSVVAIVIGQLCFQEKKAFHYMMRILTKNQNTIETICFQNIASLKSNTLSYFCEKIRNLSSFVELSFLNTSINRDSVKIIRELLIWKQQAIKRLYFIKNDFTIQNFEVLFNDQSNLLVTDLVNLQLLEVKNNPLLEDTPQLMQIQQQVLSMKQKQHSMSNQASLQARQGSQPREERGGDNDIERQHQIFGSEKILRIKEGFQLERRKIQMKEMLQNTVDEGRKGNYHVERRQALLSYSNSGIQEQINLENQHMVFDLQLDLNARELFYRIQEVDLCNDLQISQFPLKIASIITKDSLRKMIVEAKSLQYLSIQNDDEFLRALCYEFKQKDQKKTLQRLKVVGTAEVPFNENSMKYIAGMSTHIKQIKIVFGQSPLTNKCLSGFTEGLAGRDTLFQELLNMDQDKLIKQDTKRRNKQRKKSFSCDRIIDSLLLESLEILNAASFINVLASDWYLFIKKSFFVAGHRLKQFTLKNMKFASDFMEQIIQGFNDYHEQQTREQPSNKPILETFQMLQIYSSEKSFESSIDFHSLSNTLITIFGRTLKHIQFRGESNRDDLGELQIKARAFSLAEDAEEEEEEEQYDEEGDELSDSGDDNEDFEDDDEDDQINLESIGQTKDFSNASLLLSNKSGSGSEIAGNNEGNESDKDEPDKQLPPSMQKQQPQQKNEDPDNASDFSIYQQPQIEQTLLRQQSIEANKFLERLTLKTQKSKVLLSTIAENETEVKIPNLSLFSQQPQRQATTNALAKIDEEDNYVSNIQPRGDIDPQDNFIQEEEDLRAPKIKDIYQKIVLSENATLGNRVQTQQPAQFQSDDHADSDQFFFIADIPDFINAPEEIQQQNIQHQLLKHNDSSDNFLLLEDMNKFPELEQFPVVGSNFVDTYPPPPKLETNQLAAQLIGGDNDNQGSIQVAAPSIPPNEEQVILGKGAPPLQNPQSKRQTTQKQLPSLKTLQQDSIPIENQESQVIQSGGIGPSNILSQISQNKKKKSISNPLDKQQLTFKSILKIKKMMQVFDQKHNMNAKNLVNPKLRPLKTKLQKVNTFQQYQSQTRELTRFSLEEFKLCQYMHFQKSNQTEQIINDVFQSFQDTLRIVDLSNTNFNLLIVYRILQSSAVHQLQNGGTKGPRGIIALEELNLSNTQIRIKNKEDSVKAEKFKGVLLCFFAMLLKNTNLLRLDVSNCGLSSTEYNVFIRVLTQLGEIEDKQEVARLQYFDVSGNKTCSKAFSQFLSILLLVYRRSLKELRFVNTDFDHRYFDNIVDVINKEAEACGQGNSLIEIVNLSGSKFKENCGQECILIASLLNLTKSSLKELYLTNVHISSLKEFNKMFEMNLGVFQSLRSLKILNLRSSLKKCEQSQDSGGGSDRSKDFNDQLQIMFYNIFYCAGYSLTHLDLGDNALTFANINAILNGVESAYSQRIISQFPHLKELAFKCKPDLTEQNWFNLSIKPWKLRELLMSNDKNITPSEWSVLHLPWSLSILKLDREYIQEDLDWFHLMKRLMSITSLRIQKLSLKHNRINNLKAEQMIKGLKEANKELYSYQTSKTFLDLSNIKLNGNNISLSVVCDLMNNFLLQFTNNRFTQEQELQTEQNIQMQLNQLYDHRQDFLSLMKPKELEFNKIKIHDKVGCTGFLEILDKILSSSKSINQLHLYIDNHEILQKLVALNKKYNCHITRLLFTTNQQMQPELLTQFYLKFFLLFQVSELHLRQNQLDYTSMNAIIDASFQAAQTLAQQIDQQLSADQSKIKSDTRDNKRRASRFFQINFEVDKNKQTQLTQQPQSQQPQQQQLQQSQLQQPQPQQQNSALPQLQVSPSLKTYAYVMVELNLSNNKQLFVYREVENQFTILVKIFQAFHRTLEQLIISDCNLNDEISNDFSYIIQQYKENNQLALQYLDISENPQVKQQVLIQLFNNLPAETQPITLNMTGCNITCDELQELVKGSSLVNQLLCSSIDQSATSMKNLKELNFSNNQGIFPTTMHQFMKHLFIQYGGTLQVLNLSFCSIHDKKVIEMVNGIQEGIDQFRIDQQKSAKALPNALQTLILSGNIIQKGTSWTKLLQILLSCTNIKNLHIDNCGINYKSFKEVFEQLFETKLSIQLEKINMSNNYLLPLYVNSDQFIKLLKGFPIQLKSINLENCAHSSINQDSFQKVLNKLSQQKQHNVPSLEDININGLNFIRDPINPNSNATNNKIKDEPWGIFTKCLLSTFSKLTHLSIRQEKHSATPYFNQIANSYMLNEKVSVIGLQYLTISDNQYETIESWKNFWKFFILKLSNLKKLLIVSDDQGIYETKFFTAFSQILNEQIQKQHQEDYLSKKSSFKRFSNSKNTIKTIIDVKNSLEFIAYQASKEDCIYVIHQPNIQQLANNRQLIELLSAGDAIKVKRKRFYQDFWNNPNSLPTTNIRFDNNLDIVKMMSQLTGPQKNNVQKKVLIYSQLGRLKQKIEDPFYKQVNISFNFSYKNCPIFERINFLELQSLESAKENLQKIFAKVRDKLYFDYSLYLFLVESCLVSPCDSINEFFMEFSKIISSDFNQKFKFSSICFPPETKESFRLTSHQRKIITSHLKKQLLCPYYFESVGKCLKEEGEFDIIKELQVAPPSSLKVTNLSVNGLKTIYTLCYENPYYKSCEINFDQLVFVNNALSYGLREWLYKHHTSKSRFWLKYKITRGGYYFFNFFVGQNIFFKFDETVRDLNFYFQDHQFFYISLLCLILVYYIICTFFPFFMTYYEGNLNSEGKQTGVSWVSHGVYAGFAFITFIYETYLYISSLKRIKHLVPGLQLSGSSDIFSSCIDWSKKLIINITCINYKIILYFISLLTSQMARFDLYSDMAFIVVCIQHNQRMLALVSIIIISTNCLFHMYRYGNLLLTQWFNKLSSFNNNQHLNEYYEAASLLEFVALGDVLDIVSPFNVSQIPKNRFTQFVMPQFAGKTISNRIISIISRVLFEDIPQIILQILFLIWNEDDFSLMVILSFLSSIYSLFSAIYQFLSITPSVVTQLDFDELSLRKQEMFHKQMQDFRKNELEMFEQFYNFITNTKQNQNPQALQLEVEKN